jgi:hypothetical protein
LESSISRCKTLIHLISNPKFVPVRISKSLNLVNRMNSKMIIKPKYLLTCLTAALLWASPALGQVLLSGGTYSQDFDSLPSSGGANHPWANNVTLTGWYAAASNATAAVVGDATGATNIVVGGGAGNGGAFYSFGTNGVNAITDRAVGSLCSGTTFGIAFGVRFTNDTTHTLTNFIVSYTGEQWRNGGNASLATQPLTFSYRVDNLPITSPDATNVNNTGWNVVNALTFISPTTNSTAGFLDGNAATNRTALSASLGGFVLFPGQEIFLRWSDVNDPGNDHALSVDDLSVSFETNDLASLAGPTISTNPASITIPEGNSATFTVSAGGTQPLFYQWYYTNSGTLLAIDGANSSSLTTNFVPVSASGSQFFVVVTNGAQTANAVTSSIAMLTVTSSVPIVTNIAYLHTLHNANYALTDTTNLYQVEGIVTTSGDLVSSGGQSAFFQDDTGGMDLFFFSTVPGLTLPNIGDRIRVTGQLSQFNGALEIQLTENPAHKIEVLSSGNPLPAPKPFDFSAGIDPNVMEGYITNGSSIVSAVEGSYVIVSNVFLGTTNSGGILLPDQTIFMTNLTGQVFTMRVPNNALSQTALTPLPGTFAKSVRGAMAQFQTSGTVLTNAYTIYYDLQSNIEVGTPPVIVVKPLINTIKLTPDGIVISGTNNNGATAGNYAILVSTNLTLPLTSWTPVSTQAYNPDGTLSFTNPVGTDSSRFYILQVLP